MAEDAAIRLDNFRALFKPWSPAAAVARLGGSASQWSDLYYGRKSFGEKLARNIEEKLGLARGSLDDAGGPRLAHLPPDVIAAMDAADSSKVQTFHDVARAYFGVSRGESSGEFGAKAPKRNHPKADAA